MFENNLKIIDVKIEIALLVKSFRKRDKLSRKELSELLGVSRITIQNLESGKNCTIDTLLKAFQHFDAMRSFHDFILEKRKENEDVESLYE
jgi:transcriptional regulator with XRE-family HTH domain